MYVIDLKQTSSKLLRVDTSRQRERHVCYLKVGKMNVICVRLPKAAVPMRLAYMCTVHTSVVSHSVESSRFFLTKNVRFLDYSNTSTIHD